MGEEVEGSQLQWEIVFDLTSYEIEVGKEQLVPHNIISFHK